MVGRRCSVFRSPCIDTENRLLKTDNRQQRTENAMLINLLAILGPGALLVLFDELLRRGH
jgi:hypothetical protein